MDKLKINIIETEIIPGTYNPCSITVKRKTKNILQTDNSSELRRTDETAADIGEKLVLISRLKDIGNKLFVTLTIRKR